MPARREYDALARAVPRYLREVFRGRRRLMEWVRQLEKFRGQLAVLAKEPFCRRIDIERAVRDLEGARALVIRGLPYVACDCPAEQIDCEKCEGQRWLTVDEVPQRFPPWPP